MFVVIFILPSMLYVFDKLICSTTIGMKKAIAEAKAKEVKAVESKTTATV